MILKNWAEECNPMEAPALLSGIVDEKNNTGIVTDVYPMPNMEQSSVRFEIDPEEFYKIYEKSEKEGKQILGIFHSHPMDPIPSGVDLPYMKLHGNIWVILSTTRKMDNLKAYQFIDNKLNDVEIEIIGE
jgi:proteasome lid subunit RPN8/RPN11